LARGVTLSSETAKASTTLVGNVEKLIRPHPSSGEPEKAQIAVEGADHLYREIRVPNSLTDENVERSSSKRESKSISKSRLIHG